MWCFWNSAASNLPRREIKIILNASVPAGSGPLRFSACQRHHLPHLDRRGDPRAVGGYDPF